MPEQSIPMSTVRQYRTMLIEQERHLGERLAAADKQLRAAEEAAQKEFDDLNALIPEIGETPTEVEILTWRAAQADRDLAKARNDAAAAELAFKTATLNAEMNDVHLQVAHLDHFMEVGTPWAIGDEDELAAIRLDGEEATVERTYAATYLDLARRRLAHVKSLHKAIHAALRRVQKKA